MEEEATMEGCSNVPMDKSKEHRCTGCNGGSCVIGLPRYFDAMVDTLSTCSRR